MRYRRRLAALLEKHRQGELSVEALFASIHGWVEHVRYADTWGLRGAVLSTVRLGPWGQNKGPGGGDSAPGIE